MGDGEKQKKREKLRYKRKTPKERGGRQILPSPKNCYGGGASKPSRKGGEKKSLWNVEYEPFGAKY